MGGTREDTAPEASGLSYQSKLSLVIPWLRKKHPNAVDINYDFDTGCFWVHFADKSMLKVRGDEIVDEAFPPVVKPPIIADLEKAMQFRTMVNSGEAGQYTGESSSHHPLCPAGRDPECGPCACHHYGQVNELQIRKADVSVTALLFIPIPVANKLSPAQFSELKNHVLEAYRVKVRELIGY